MSNTPTTRLDASLAGRKLADDYELSGLSPQEINRMSMADYARIREGAGLPAADPFAVAYAPPAPQQAPAPHSAPQPSAGQPEGLDPNSEGYFHAWRENRAHGGAGRGIFDSVDSRSDAYTNAVRAQSGRTAISNQNVEQPPRLEGRFVNQDDLRDPRSAAERFGTPGNSFQR